MRIRVTGILIKSQEVLVLEENVNGRKISFPGGGVEEGETLEDALKREFLEEVNLHITIDKILYISEYKRNDGISVVEITFAVTLPNAMELNNSHKFISFQSLETLWPTSKALKVIQQSNVAGIYLGLRQA